MRSHAVDKIQRQPYYSTLAEKARKIGGYQRLASFAARQMLDQLNRVTYFNNPKTRIRQQPFFGVDSSLPTTIKFRRPASFLKSVDNLVIYDDVVGDMDSVDTSIEPMKIFMEAPLGWACGNCHQLNKRHEVMCKKCGQINSLGIKGGPISAPLYTLDDICWKSYA